MSEVDAITGRATNLSYSKNVADQKQNKNNDKQQGTQVPYSVSLSVNPFATPAPAKVSFWDKIGNFISDVVSIGYESTPAATIYNPPLYVTKVSASVPAGTYNTVMVSFNASTDIDPGVNILQYQIIGVPKSLVGTAAYPTIDDLISAVSAWNMPTQAWTKYETDPSKAKYNELYTDIPTGDYIIMVRAQNDKNLWSPINYVAGSNPGSDSIYGADAAEPVVSVAAAPATQPPTSATVNSAAFSVTNGTGTVTVTHTISTDPQGEAVTYEAFMINQAAADKAYGSLQGLLDRQNSKQPISWNATTPDFAPSTGTLSISPVDPAAVPAGQYYVLVLAKNADGLFSQVSVSQVKTISVSWPLSPVTINTPTIARITGTSDYNVSDVFNTIPGQAANVTYNLGMVDTNKYPDAASFIAAYNAHPENVKWDAGSGWITAAGATGTASILDQALTPNHSYYTFVIAQDNNGRTSQLAASSVQTVLAPVNQLPNPVSGVSATSTKTANGYNVTVTHGLSTDPDGTIAGYKAAMLKTGVKERYATAQDFYDAINGVNKTQPLTSDDYVAGTIFAPSTGTITIPVAGNLTAGDYTVFVLAQDNDGASSLVNAGSVATVTISAAVVPQGPDPVTINTPTIARITGTSDYNVSDVFNTTKDNDAGVTSITYNLGMVDTNKYPDAASFMAAYNAHPENIKWDAGSGWVAAAGATGTASITNQALTPNHTYYTFVIAQDNNGRTSQLAASSVQTVLAPVNQLPNPVTGVSAISTKTANGYNVTVTHGLSTDPDGTVGGYKAAMLKSGVKERYATDQDFYDAINGKNATQPLTSDDYVAGTIFAPSTGTITIPVVGNLAAGDYKVYVVAQDNDGASSLVNAGSVATVTISAAVVPQGPDPVTINTPTIARITGTSDYNVSDVFNTTKDNDAGVTSITYNLGMVDTNKYPDAASFMAAYNAHPENIKWDAGSGWITAAGATGTASILDQALTPGHTYYTFVIAQDNNGRTSQLAASSVQTVLAPANQLPNPVSGVSASEAPAANGYSITVTHGLSTDSDGTVGGYKAAMLKTGVKERYATAQDFYDAINGKNATQPLTSDDYVAGTIFAPSTGTITIPVVGNLTAGDYTVYVVAQDNDGASSLVNAGSVATVTISAATVTQGPNPVTMTSAAAARIAGSAPTGNKYNVTGSFNTTTDQDPNANITDYQMGIVAASDYSSAQNFMDTFNTHPENVHWVTASDWVTAAGATGTASILNQALTAGKSYYVFTIARDNKKNTSKSITSVQTITPIDNVLPDPVTITSVDQTKTASGWDIKVAHSASKDSDGTLTAYIASILKPNLVGAGKKYATLQDLIDAVNNKYKPGDAQYNPLLSDDYLTSATVTAVADNGTITIPITWTVPQGNYTIYVQAQDNDQALSLVNGMRGIFISAAGGQTRPNAVTGVKSVTGRNSKGTFVATTFPDSSYAVGTNFHLGIDSTYAQDSSGKYLAVLNDTINPYTRFFGGGTYTASPCTTYISDQSLYFKQDSLPVVVSVQAEYNNLWSLFGLGSLAWVRLASSLPQSVQNVAATNDPKVNTTVTFTWKPKAADPLYPKIYEYAISLYKAKRVSGDMAVWVKTIDNPYVPQADFYKVIDADPATGKLSSTDPDITINPIGTSGEYSITYKNIQKGVYIAVIQAEDVNGKWSRIDYSIGSTTDAVVEKLAVGMNTSVQPALYKIFPNKFGSNENTIRMLVPKNAAGTVKVNISRIDNGAVVRTFDVDVSVEDNGPTTVDQPFTGDFKRIAKDWSQQKRGLAPGMYNYKVISADNRILHANDQVQIRGGE